MKKTRAITGLYLLLTGLLTVNVGDVEATDIDQKIKTDTVNKIGELMEQNYVFPETGEKTARVLLEKLSAGDFDQIDKAEEFSKALTQAIQQVTHDKHLRVRQNRSGGRHHSQQDRVDDTLNRREHHRQSNFGVAQVRKLEGNVGYLELKGFYELSEAKEAIDASMALLKTSDALIIDLRKNGGGDPHLVQYLSSYFFEQRLLLNSLYWRKGDITNEFWTLDKVDGIKLATVPLYILTSGRTFSAAEEFSYNMQTRKRATLIGETTGGGANPGGGFRINDHFGMFIATGRAINPVTNTNWEGVGVVPEIKVDADGALEKAIELAKEKAKSLRLASRESYKTAMSGFDRLLDSTYQKLKKSNVEKVEANFFSKMEQFNQKLAMTEDQINQLGYQHIMDKSMPEIGLLLMKFNVNTYPDSANAFDSLGDAWLAMNKPDMAKLSFEQGLKLANIDNQQLRHALEANLAKANELLKQNQ